MAASGQMPAYEVIGVTWTGLGRLDTVTNGHFQVSEFNGCFPAMNLKTRRFLSEHMILSLETADPFIPLWIFSQQKCL